MSEEVESEARALFEDRKALYLRLREIEADAVEWIGDLVKKRSKDGIGAATQALERIGKRVDDIEARMGGGEAPRNVLVRFDWGDDDGEETYQESKACGEGDCIDG